MPNPNLAETSKLYKARIQLESVIQHPDDSLRELTETGETLFVNEYPLQRNHS
jgi:hypothetical protein